ncbi:restriction endonuclease [Janthinobacterium sp. 75]|uniref:putative holin n=1 Tax=Janthinobacterium sp. 75 TaxID=2135628 RepID=UPI001062E40A|nr:restriction endonuclease [Janthinobacterium sp. 75]TDY35082.1 hypothetical protein C8C89_2928 [Janthinobacterium sp. 75]
MTEPATITAAGGALALGTVTLTGSILGLEYDVLLVGLAGGLVALSMVDQTSRLKMVISVMTSALVAGYVGPIAHAGALEYFPWTAKSADAVRWFCAFAAGVSAQTIVPLGLGWLKKRGGSQ